MGAVAWAVGCVAAIVLAIIGVERLVELLPPLQIDTEAVRGAVTAAAVGFAFATLLHLGVIVGLRRHHRRAWSAGILLGALFAATFIALTAAAFTSAVTTPASAAALAGAGVGASVAALGYLLVTLRLVGELRSGSAG